MKYNTTLSIQHLSTPMPLILIFGACRFGGIVLQMPNTTDTSNNRIRITIISVKAVLRSSLFVYNNNSKKGIIMIEESDTSPSFTQDS
jgi:hypothetical protein